MPDDARAALGLQPGERVIAHGRRPDGAWVAATERALLGAGLRVEWTDVAHAQWLDEEQVLALDPVPGAGEPLRLSLPEPGRVPETVHERVMASIVVSRRVAAPGGGVRVVGRRAAGSEETIWQAVPDAGTDLADPQVRAVVDATVAQLADELG